MYTEYEYLAHSGIRGMKWGIRRFRNEDGTLTEAGKKRYAKLNAKVDKEYAKAVKGVTEKADKVRAAMVNQTYKGKTLLSAQQGAILAVEKNVLKYNKKLSDIKKKEIDKGLNYYENELKKATRADLLLAFATASTGWMVYSNANRMGVENKYKEGRAQRESIKKKYSDSLIGLKDVSKGNKAIRGLDPTKYDFDEDAYKRQKAEEKEHARRRKGWK